MDWGRKSGYCCRRSEACSKLFSARREAPKRAHAMPIPYWPNVCATMSKEGCCKVFSEVRRGPLNGKRHLQSSLAGLHTKRIFTKVGIKRTGFEPSSFAFNRRFHDVFECPAESQGLAGPWLILRSCHALTWVKGISGRCTASHLHAEASNLGYLTRCDSVDRRHLQTVRCG